MGAADEIASLLYRAHRDVVAMFVQVDDSLEEEPSNALVAGPGTGGGIELRWVGSGPYGRRSLSERRVWFCPPDRTRVEVSAAGRLVRVGVRDGSGWWRWDLENGETAGNLESDQSLPPILDAPLLEPVRLLTRLWLEPDGIGELNGRRTIRVIGVPRSRSASSRRMVRFEFDAEHGTPLQTETLEDGVRVAMTRVTAVDFNAEFDEDVFRFALRDLPPSPSPGSRAEVLSRSPPSDNAAVTFRRRVVQPDVAVVWLTGLSGSGKSTTAREVERILLRLGVQCCVLDGDEIRNGLSNDLGMSRNDRREQARRVAHVAALLAGSGIVPVVALVSPYARDRRMAREISETAGVRFFEVWVNTPLEVCAERDVKGLYGSHHTGTALGSATAEDGSGLTGVASPYEVPAAPDLVVSGHSQVPRVAAQAIVAHTLSSAPRSYVFPVGSP